MPYPDNDALDTPEMDAERARLDAGLRADANELNEIDADIGSREIALARRKINRVRVRVAFGIKFERRIELTPYRERTRYMRDQARRWGFGWRKAYDNRAYARLHLSNPEHFTFARLAKLTLQEVREEHSRLGENPVTIGRVSERLAAEKTENAVEAAALLLARLDPRARRRLVELEQQGVKHKARRGWLAGAVMRRGEPMTEEERSRGLSQFMADSGAYAKATRGRINIADYSNTLLENPWIKLYANLDEVNRDEPEQAATVSYRNFKYMRERGLDPIPVYHNRENISWLQKYIYEEGCDYIGLSDVANSTVERNRVFFDRCFKIIGKAGRPIRTHAFGVAHEATLVNFPFTSADSAAWLIRAQVARNSDLSRLGDAAWRASLHERENNDRWYAATTFLEAYDAQHLERQIRENPERRHFCFFLAVPQEDNVWWLPALWVAHHRNALVANRPGWDAALIKRFIDDPLSVLTQPRFVGKLELLQEMKVLYFANMKEQVGRQRERDRNRP
jgi:hypothetical protein